MTSYNQTALLQLVAAPFAIDTYCRRPLMPFAAKKKFAEGYNVKLTRYDGAIIKWYVSGVVVEKLFNGDTTIFQPKPTLTETIKIMACGNYTQFLKGGAVILRNGPATFYWSEDIPTFEENGEFFFDHYCGDDLVWDDECKGCCDYDSECEPCYYCGAKDSAEIFNRFCSRSCMKDYMGEY